MGEKSLSGDLVLTVPERDVREIAKRLREHYRAQYESDFPETLIRTAIKDWLDLRLVSFTADLPEMLTSRSRSEAREFHRYVERLHERELEKVHRRNAAVDRTEIFTGRRPFSFDKLEAMAVYIADRLGGVHKTKLNKLLFYSDFVNYAMQGTSISGARYVHLPYGPVPDDYEASLAKMTSTGAIHIQDDRGGQIVAAIERTTAAQLQQPEEATIDWVLANFGAMTASEISEFSHSERAYRDTRPGECIAYEYAKFLQKLPGGQ